MISDVVGVVLSGGKSTRMGRDKAAIEFGGEPMLERAVAALSLVFDAVLVAGDSTVAAEVETVTDVIAHGGPLSGLDAVYRRAEGKAVFLLAVDLPFVDAGVIREIAGPGVESTGTRVPVTRGRLQPLCALYGADLGPHVRDHLESDDRSMFGFIASIEDVDLVEMDPDVFENVNTAEELSAALKRFGQHRSTH
ncbi:MAG: molybdenum cofactor guanylyltransferase [Acidimicrobiia bacterium]